MPQNVCHISHGSQSVFPDVQRDRSLEAIDDWPTGGFFLPLGWMYFIIQTKYLAPACTQHGATQLLFLTNHAKPTSFVVELRPP